MRKPLLTLLAGLLATPFAHAALPVTVAPGPALTVVGGYTDAVVQTPTVTLTNTGTRSLTLGLKRFVLSAAGGSENNFCFGAGCYPPTVSVAPQPITLAGGASDQSFVGDYTPNGYAGVAVIRYAVYEVGTTDTVSFTVTYDASRATAPTGTAKALETSPLLGALTPNPVAHGEFVNVAVTLPRGETGLAAARLVVVDLQSGRRVHSEQATARLGWCGTVSGSQSPANTFTMAVPTHQLAAGVYGCLLEVGGKAQAMRRLVVQ